MTCILIRSCFTGFNIMLRYGQMLKFIVFTEEIKFCALMSIIYIIFYKYYIYKLYILYLIYIL